MPTVAELFDQLIDQLADDVAEKVMPKVDERIAEKLAANEPVEQPKPVEPDEDEFPIAAQISNSKGGEWQFGVSVQTPRFMIRETSQAKAAFVKGARVRFSDGQVRKITEVAVAHGNIYPTVEGEKLSPSVGYPNTVSASKGDAEQEDELSVPKPDPVPSKPGTGRKGIVGTNLGMGQGASNRIPGTQGTDFNYPIESEIIRAKGYGLTRFRVGGLFERFFKRQGSTEMYLGKDAKGKEYSSASVIRVGQLCKKHGCTVLWNPFHNYGTVFGKKVGSSDGLTAEQFGQAWRTFILHVKSDPDAWAATHGFDLMNEWSGMQFDPIFDATQAVLDACADILEDKFIVPEGKDYSSTANWVRNNDGFKNLKDPRGPGFIEFSGHLYLDQDASGFYKSGDTARAPHTPESVGVDRLKGFADWIDQHGFRGNIGETIVPGDMPGLLKGLDNMLVMARDRGIDVYMFGLGDWFSDSYTTVHNLEIGRNRPTLELVQKFTKAQA